MNQRKSGVGVFLIIGDNTLEEGLQLKYKFDLGQYNRAMVVYSILMFQSTPNIVECKCMPSLPYLLAISLLGTNKVLLF